MKRSGKQQKDQRKVQRDQENKGDLRERKKSKRVVRTRKENRNGFLFNGRRRDMLRLKKITDIGHSLVQNLAN